MYQAVGSVNHFLYKAVRSIFSPYVYILPTFVDVHTLECSFTHLYQISRFGKTAAINSQLSIKLVLASTPRLYLLVSDFRPRRDPTGERGSVVDIYKPFLTN